MSLIPDIIPPQGFEVVRDQIYAIIGDELANQYTLSGDDNFNVTVELERTTPIQATEMPIVNVRLDRATLEAQSQKSTTDEMYFRIECYHSAKYSDTEDGGSLSQLRLQKLIGMCRAILESNYYKTLGLADGKVGYRKGESIEIADAAKHDNMSTSMGVLMYKVRADETVQHPQGVAFGGQDTQMTLELTDKGYKYIVNS